MLYKLEDVKYCGDNEVIKRLHSLFLAFLESLAPVPHTSLLDRLSLEQIPHKLHSAYTKGNRAKRAQNIQENAKIAHNSTGDFIISRRPAQFERMTLALRDMCLTHSTTAARKLGMKLLLLK